MKEKLARNAIAVYASLAVRLSGGMAISAILARKLSVQDFGVLAICTGMGAFYWTICDFGVSLRGQKIFTNRAASAVRLADFYHAALRFRALIAVVALPVAFGVGMLHHEVGYGDSLLLLSAFAFGWSSAASPNWILSLQQRNLVSLPFDMAAVLLGLLGAILCVNDRDSLWIILAIPAATNVALIGWFSSSGPRPSMGRRSHVIVWLRYFAPALVLRSVYTVVSIGLVAIYSTVNPAAMVAIYAAADRIMRFALSGLSPVFSLSSPYLFSAAHATTRKKRNFRLVFILVHGGVGLLATGAMVIVAPAAIRLLYGQKYDASISTMVILSVALPFWMIENAIINQMLVQEGRERIALGIVATVAVGLILAIMIGIVREPRGMAIATVSIELFAAIGGLFALARKRRTSLP